MGILFFALDDMDEHSQIVEMPEPLGLFSGQLFDRAAEYHEAFRALAPLDGQLMHVKYFLLAHAIEIYLKSYLAAKGIPKSEMRSQKKYGHDLEKIYAKCDELGMPYIDNLELFARDINHKNSNFDFRYPSNFILRVPSPRLCLEVMDPLQARLKPIIEQTRVSANIRLAYDTRHLQGKKLRWSD